jgi:3-hydroxyisobutyrate dehydrogenase/2-hydroxy-3-oxopropionate reductase
MTTNLGTHLGPVSGQTHVHLLRENAAARTGHSADLPRVAVLGTGKMGSAIAGRIAGLGFELTLWNRTRSRAEALEIGTVADSAAEAARDADIVVSSLTGPEAVRAAYFGQNGALSGAEGKLFIEMSTAGPDLVSELAAAVEAAGARLVDAPVLGAPTVVATGEAAILVGGTADDVERAMPILSLLGTVRHVGQLGSAARLKLVANSMLADVVLAAAELQVAGEEAGLAPDDVFWVIKRLSPLLEARRHGYLENRHEPSLFAVRDLLKDLDLAVDLFGRSGARTPLTAVSRDLVVAAAEASPDLDITAVIRPYRREIHSNR